MGTACSGANAARPAPGVCPVKPGAPVTQIDIFDGDPAEQAFLAPDDDHAGSRTYSVKSVYDAGRTLTIRCHHGDATDDVRLSKPVSRCKLTGSDARPVLTCN